MRNPLLFFTICVFLSGCGIFGPPDPPPVIQLDQVQRHTNQATISINGSATGLPDKIATIEIIGGQALVTANANSQGVFTVPVSLRPNQSNNLSIVAFYELETRSNPSSVSVTHDNIAPDAPIPDAPRYTNQNPFALSGSSEAGALISAATASGTAQATTAAAGNFSIAVPMVLNSSTEIRIIAQDSAANQGPSSVFNVIHDDVSPTLETQIPSDSVFDTDQDSRVNIAFSFDDDSGGIDPTTISVTNDLPIGGGAEMGGYDTGTNLIHAFSGDDITIEDKSVTYNASLDHEFKVGTNTLTVSVADSAGNTQTDIVEFEVFGTEPTFNITSPTGGDTPLVDSLTVSSEFSDVAGRINENSLVFIADQKLIGLLSQEGTKADDIEAEENFAHLFNITSTAASFQSRSSDGLATYTFPEGETTISGSIADRAGNTSKPDSVTFTNPAYPHTLLVVNSTAAPAAVEHVVPIGLTNLTPFRALQFTVEFPTSVMTVDSVTSAGRVPFSPFFEHSINGDEGSVKIVLVDLGGDVIMKGSDVMIHIYTSVNAGAPVPSDAALVISDVTASSEVGNPLDIAVYSGILRIR